MQKSTSKSRPKSKRNQTLNQSNKNNFNVKIESKNKSSKENLDQSINGQFDNLNLMSKSPNRNASKKNINVKEKNKIEIEKDSSSVEDYSNKNIKLNFSNEIKDLINEIDIGPKRIRLGLCCLNNYLRNQKKTIFCSRSIVLATYLAKGSQIAIEK